MPPTARYAAALGASVVIYKADSRENYIRGAGPFLDALQSHLFFVLRHASGG